MPCFCRCFVEAVEKAKHWIYLRRVGGKNALGIVAKSPQHSEDLQRKARPDPDRLPSAPDQRHQGGADDPGAGWGDPHHRLYH